MTLTDITVQNHKVDTNHGSPKVVEAIFATVRVELETDVKIEFLMSPDASRKIKEICFQEVKKILKGF